MLLHLRQRIVVRPRLLVLVLLVVVITWGLRHLKEEEEKEERGRSLVVVVLVWVVSKWAWLSLLGPINPHLEVCDVWMDRY